jgi:hypothetical protein
VKFLLILIATYLVVGAMLALALFLLPRYREARQTCISPTLYALFILFAWLPLMLAPRMPREQAERIAEIVRQ